MVLALAAGADRLTAPAFEVDARGVEEDQVRTVDQVLRATRRKRGRPELLVRG